MLCVECFVRAQVTQGIYHHNVHGAGAAVAAGAAEPEDFRFFAQYAGWAPGQLEEECKSGVWFCTAASPSLTLNQELSNGGAMWHAILQVMGGAYPSAGRPALLPPGAETHAVC